jgi:hypothetical protein
MGMIKRIELPTGAAATYHRIESIAHSYRLTDEQKAAGLRSIAQVQIGSYLDRDAARRGAQPFTPDAPLAPGARVEIPVGVADADVRAYVYARLSLPRQTYPVPRTVPVIDERTGNQLLDDNDEPVTRTELIHLPVGIALPWEGAESDEDPAPTNG